MASATMKTAAAEQISGSLPNKNSGIYRGVVYHQRHRPIVNAFRYRLFMMYLDLDELPELFRPYWLWSAESYNIARFRRADHLGPPEQPLKEAVADLVEERLGFRPDGSIRLLTNLRYWGFVMNPVSFYYCYNQQDELVAFVAEVHNTPWGEMHCYVLPWEHGACNEQLSAGVEVVGGEVSVLTAEHEKAFHVSPFLPMEMRYRWQVSAPGEKLTAQIINYDEAGSPFSARLDLRRQEISSWQMAWTLLNYPWMTAKVIAAIYWQAVKLWSRGAVYYPHP